MATDLALGGTITIGGEMTVPRMGFGAMRLTGPGIWGDLPDRRAGIEVLHRVRDLGVRFIDTADAYGPEVNESLIADALGPFRDIAVATKGGITRPSRRQWTPDGRPEHLRAACDASLKRLGVDRIDLYQLHRPDAQVPFEDSVGVLAELRADGKVRHVGLSNVSVDELQRAQRLVPVVSVQNRYNVGDRTSDDVLHACGDQQIVFLPWAPIASGRVANMSGPLQLVANRHHATTTQIALAWLLQRSPVMLPIPGTSSIAHLEENTAAAGISLTPEDLADLDS